MKQMKSKKASMKNLNYKSMNINMSSDQDLSIINYIESNKPNEFNTNFHEVDIKEDYLEGFVDHQLCINKDKCTHKVVFSLKSHIYKNVERTKGREEQNKTSYNQQ